MSILWHIYYFKKGTLLCKSKPVTFVHVFKEPLSCFEPSGSAGWLCYKRLACWDAHSPRPSLQRPPASSLLLLSHIPKVRHCLPGNISFNDNENKTNTNNTCCTCTVGYVPDRSPLLHSRYQHTSFEELNTSHRHWSGRRQIEQLPLPELALSHLSQSLEEE